MRPTYCYLLHSASCKYLVKSWPLPPINVTFPPFSTTSGTYSPSLSTPPPVSSPSLSHDWCFWNARAQRFGNSRNYNDTAIVGTPLSSSPPTSPCDQRFGNSCDKCFRSSRNSNNTSIFSLLHPSEHPPDHVALTSAVSVHRALELQAPLTRGCDDATTAYNSSTLDIHRPPMRLPSPEDAQITAMLTATACWTSTKWSQPMASPTLGVLVSHFPPTLIFIIGQPLHTLRQIKRCYTI